jgi:cell wall-associated NlpC family hydrolase
MSTKRSTGLAFVAGLAVCVLMHAKKDDQQPEPAAAVAAPVPPAPEPQRKRRVPARLATALAFAVLFCAGGAFSAVAGNELVSVDEESTLVAETTTAVAETTTTTETTTEATTEAATTETVEAVAEPDPSDAAPAPHVFADQPVAASAPAARVVQRTATPAAKKHAAPKRQPAHVVALPFPVITFDPAEWVAHHPATPAGASAVAIASQYLGVPYVWGGNTPRGGFDCSGLTQFVYAQLGVWLPHYAASQFVTYPHVGVSDLRAGDLVFFEPKADGPGHVALYAGGDRIVEAPHTGATVRYSSLSGAAAKLGFMGAVRPPSDAAEPLDRPLVGPGEHLMQ